MIAAWLRERVPRPEGASATMAGGASFAHSLGAALVFLLVVEAVTGIALAAFYSPSTTDAWASIAYLESRASWGWLVRGLHHHGGSAIVIVAGLHLLQTAISGAYKRPREVVWWLGIVSLLLCLAWSLTGFWLRWDQASYWAAQVELGIVAETPVIGDTLRAVVVGGNAPGNLTLTRAYALHIGVLPALVVLVTIAHVRLARRHGATPVRAATAPVPRWPHQSVRDAIAMALVLSAVLAYVVMQGGVELAAPADPTAAHDARPLWPMRWLFELRHLAGDAEQLAALVAPALVVGYLVTLPLLDRGPSRRIRPRLLWLGGLAGLCSIIGALTVASFVRDANDEGLAERQNQAEQTASRARALAARYGVPLTGARDVYGTPPMHRARTLFAQRCAGCHAPDSKDRKGPVIAPGHGNRAWLTSFLRDPSHDTMWGRTKLAKTEEAMGKVEMPDAELADLVERLYAESGASDVDPAKRDRGVASFEKACTDCHAIDDGMPGAAAPGLAGLGSRDWYRTMISNPKSSFHMGTKSEMPRFDRDLSLTDRDLLAEYLVWLRTASQRDLDALGAL